MFRRLRQRIGAAAALTMGFLRGQVVRVGTACDISVCQIRHIVRVGPQSAAIDDSFRGTVW
ncbi:hypothetical protein AWC04_13895 [Mycolicibacterium fallax]|uniref:Uncharacterized protein n=1 Tax=Mycolicibacterium fallax TaxID=1793 RepID=A0A1X1R8T4_MYCFA|nr:hypothetical protein AWC04_13895 [Mycolicibacterium fallax]